MFTTRPPTASPLLSLSETLNNQNLIHKLYFPISYSKPNKSISYFKSSPLKAVIATKNESQSPVSQTPSQTRVDILSESLPFIQRFRGKTIVVKYGGAAMKSESLQASVINDLVILSCVGFRLVFVHGGGPEINSWLSRLGIKPNFLNGIRVTDASTMEIVEIVLVGKVNKQWVSLINKAGATAVGLSGKDSRLLTVRPNIKSAELGFVGDIAGVDPSIPRSLISSGHIPMIASVGADVDGLAYNINADNVAGESATALGAEKLILLTDVAEILEDRDDPGSLVKEIDIKVVRKMVDEEKIAGGMIPKVTCHVRSLAQGVRTASIIDGRLRIRCSWKLSLIKELER